MQNDDGSLSGTLHVPLYPDQLFLASEARRYEALQLARALTVNSSPANSRSDLLPPLAFEEIEARQARIERASDSAPAEGKPANPVTGR